MNQAQNWTILDYKMIANIFKNLKRKSNKFYTQNFLINRKEAKTTKTQ